MSETANEEIVRLDRENPWPGLAPFTENCWEFFHGRENETRDMLRLVQREPLTVLYGQSGLGKTSMLQAGLIPKLRASDFLPIYLRLDHDETGPPLARQVAIALSKSIEEGLVDAQLPKENESLWEYFHRTDVDFWSRRNRLLTPVLVFDQFEEIFTLGRATDARRIRSDAFISELGCLIENRPSAALTERFDKGEADPAAFEFEGSPCRVVLSLREDFLADLRGLRKHFRPVTGQSEMRLTRMNGTQALEAIELTGRTLVQTEVAGRIVQFVAGAPVDGGAIDAQYLTSLQVEPALLSVICRELNNKRRAKGDAQISIDLLSGSQGEILAEFYDHSLRGMPASTARFIENKLLTRSGYRDSVALENAIGSYSISRRDIDTLINRRLLRLDDRMGVPRVELMHDVLTGIIRDRRDRRDRRRQLMVTIATVSLAVVLTYIGWEWNEVVFKNKKLLIIFEDGKEKLELGERREALAQFTSAWQSGLRREDLSSALADASKGMVNPLKTLTGHSDWVSFAAFVDLDHVVTASWDKTVRLWDWRKESFIKIADESAKVSCANFTPSMSLRPVPDNRFVIATNNGECELRRRDGTIDGNFKHEDSRVNWASFSPDGKLIVTAADEPTVRIWDASTLKQLRTLPLKNENLDGHTDFVKTAVFICDGAYVLTGSFDKTIKIWETSSGKFKGNLEYRKPERVMAAAYNPKASIIASANGDGSVHLWQVDKDRPWVVEGSPRFLSGHGDKRVNSVAFNNDGSRLVTAGDDRTAKVWDLSSNSKEPILAFEGHKDFVVYAAFSGDGKLVVTACKDGTAMVFNAIPVNRTIEEIVSTAAEFPPIQGRVGNSGKKKR